MSDRKIADASPATPTKRQRFGPGLLVTAAFIGPGTVTTASVAGAEFGFALVWAAVFAILATMVMQEMAARLGIVSRAGLGEALRATFTNPVTGVIVAVLVVAAIAVGNAAFQTGNIAGAAVALTTISGVPTQVWAVAVGVLAFGLLYTGIYRFIEAVMIALVGVMTIVFIVTAVVVRPDLGALAAGLVPTIPDGSTITVIALIGTTVVPYNLFLHASSVRQKWTADIPLEKSLPQARTDTYVSVGVGGVITLAVVTTAAASLFAHGLSVSNGADMAQQLEPLLGPAAKWFFAVGLFAAGLTSAITAPLAAAFAVSGMLGWRMDLKSWRFRGVWVAVLVIGAVLAVAVGESPVPAIIFAQTTNGLLLPIIAVFLLVVVNRKQVMGEHRNSLARNLAGGTVVLVATGLGVFNILKGLGVLA
ncbi:Nramp family divalent metal transporter [Stackebrandtia nassauensis]|uniref:Natural resistance-associated macrophage protein n=1 Tax=Stackebrandtia nassauensis (strain DSM 44728 / CIP 108903 / NRRL B-16338 / NBRC 102104 / LLR-40K-21) TaxID=446470 RepID=D3Q483_STANL|nr:Nramp family divalent metal transporter [Stackebrandtia nassauensis]ADD45968.1 natural resistance-associated macrophage protein [Stackebrandtia nassauensis DSM 44728]